VSKGDRMSSWGTAGGRSWGLAKGGKAHGCCGGETVLRLSGAHWLTSRGPIARQNGDGSRKGSSRDSEESFLHGGGGEGS